MSLYIDIFNRRIQFIHYDYLYGWGGPMLQGVLLSFS